MIEKKIKSILYKIKKLFFNVFLIKKSNNDTIFEKIYKKNYWGSAESISGPGSDLINTQNIRIELPKIISKYKIQKVIDVPCGDFNWMKLVVDQSDIDYLGCDIVEELINLNKKLYSSNKVNFSKLNLMKDQLPDSDLLICRALFYHLDFFSIKKILENFKRSNIKYVLLTNSPNLENFINKDIINGQFRDLDLFKAPLLFPSNYLYKFEDIRNSDTNIIEQEMILWKMDELLNNINL
ncbi:class I SAM-dependent methyltransferase [Candidatus Pelagibacter sp. Uisw_127]|uniref:class I SAM-dependent methyltransferase n=1 Tax=Candidatus Pelagibacter sp. Uisw_127 TaxID=3230988 RepID=UPI0039E921F4